MQNGMKKKKIALKNEHCIDWSISGLEPDWRLLLLLLLVLFFLKKIHLILKSILLTRVLTDPAVKCTFTWLV